MGAAARTGLPGRHGPSPSITVCGDSRLGGPETGAQGANPLPPGTHVSSSPFTVNNAIIVTVIATGLEGLKCARPCAKPVVLTSHLIITRTSEVGTIMISILQIRKLRLRRVNFPDQDPAIRKHKQGSWDLDLGSLGRKTMLS